MITNRTQLDSVVDMTVEQIKAHLQDKFTTRKPLKIEYCYSVLDTISLLEQYDIKYPGLQDKLNKVLENYE